MIPKKYNAPGEKWFEIGTQEFEDSVDGYIKNPESALSVMKSHPGVTIVKTPYAFFRWVDEV